MKKILLIICTMTILLFTAGSTKAQAFAGKGSKYFTLGVGVAHYIEFGGYRSTYGYGYGYGYGFGFFRPTLAVNANIEIGIHKYVGIAPCFGFSTTFYTGGEVGLEIPLGVQANFHFFQLIGDKTGKSFADKLDIYAGANVGGGPTFGLFSGGLSVYGFIYAGPQVGIRYYPKSNIGITAEIGYGKTIANVGMVIKMK